MKILMLKKKITKVKNIEGQDTLNIWLNIFENNKETIENKSNIEEFDKHIKQNKSLMTKLILKLITIIN